MDMCAAGVPMGMSMAMQMQPNNMTYQPDYNSATGMMSNMNNTSNMMMPMIPDNMASVGNMGGMLNTNSMANMGGLSNVSTGGDMGMGTFRGGMNLQLNAQEMQFYPTLYTMLDPQGLGYVEGDTAAAFLKTSGLPTHTLHEVWRISDSSNTGRLNVQNFFAACRLVAHAQNGVHITDDTFLLEPQSLPVFDMRQPTQLDMSATPDTSYAAALPPYLSSAGAPPPFPSGGSVGMPLTDTYTGGVGDMGGEGALWTIPEIDKQKYLRIFQMTDSNFDGFVEGSEGKDVLSKSMLPDSELMQIWSLADQDQDGRLSMQEFLVAMHLVSCRHKGYSIPNALPRELQMILTSGGVSPPQTLSLGASPSPPFFPSEQPPVFPSNQPETKTERPAGEEKNEGDAWKDFEQRTEVTDTQEYKKKKKDRKKSRSKEREEDSDKEKEGGLSFGDLVCSESEKQKEKDKKLKKEKSKKGTQYAFSSVDEPSKLSQDEDEGLSFPFSRGEIFKGEKSKRQSLYDGDKLRSHFAWKETPSALIESVIEADKRISKSIASDVDRHNDELQRLNQATVVLKAEIAREKSELERQVDRKKDFERQVEDARIELEQLKEERRKVDLVRISLHRDIDHYKEEIVFLKQQIEDMQKDVEMLDESNQMLDKTYKQSESQIKSLDSARRNVMDTIKEEKEALQKEERETNELKHTIQRMKREKEDVQAKHAMLQERLKQQQWMQSESFPSSAFLARDALSDGYEVLSSSMPAGDMRKSASTLVRNNKGIPASAPSVLPPSPSQFRYTYESLSHKTSTDSPSWSVFGSSRLAPARAAGGGGSGGTEGYTHKKKDERGINRILALADSTQSSPQFNKEGGYLGNRRDDKLFAASSNRRAKESDEQTDARISDVGRLHSSGWMRRPDELHSQTYSNDNHEKQKKDNKSAKKSTSRSSSRGKTAMKKSGDVEVRFSGSLDDEFADLSLEKDKREKDKKIKGRGSAASKGGFEDGDDRTSTGLETPSFGARSLNRSNSMNSQ